MKTKWVGTVHDWMWDEARILNEDAAFKDFRVGYGGDYPDEQELIKLEIAQQHRIYLDEYPN